MSREEILKKALKFKQASLRGDNKELAEKKFNEMFVDHSITFEEFKKFEQHSERNLAPYVEVNGMVFYTAREFETYYSTLGLLDRAKIAMQVAKALKNKK